MKRKSGAGFTLIEILIVMVIIVTLAGLGLFTGIDAYRGYAFRAERDIIVSTLEKARSRSLNNLFQSPHGVCYDSANHNYIIFRGTTCTPGAPTNETIPANTGVSVSGMDTASPVVFTQLSGTVVGTSIHLKDNNTFRETDISINTEGRINW